MFERAPSNMLRNRVSDLGGLSKRSRVSPKASSTSRIVCRAFLSSGVVLRSLSNSRDSANTLGDFSGTLGLDRGVKEELRVGGGGLERGGRVCGFLDVDCGLRGV